MLFVTEKTALALAGHRHHGATIWGAKSNILTLTKGNLYMDFSFRNAGLFRCLGRAGVPGLDMSHWIAFWAFRGTPKAIIAKLKAATVSALADSTAHSRLASFGQEIFPRDQQTPQALGALHKADREVVADYQDREHQGRVNEHLKNFHNLSSHR